MNLYKTDGKSQITREIRALKKTREFYNDNESEIISGESFYSKVALIRVNTLCAFAVQIKIARYLVWDSFSAVFVNSF